MAIFSILDLKAEELTILDFSSLSQPCLFLTRSHTVQYVHSLGTIFSQTGILNYGKVNASRKLSVNVLGAELRFLLSLKIAL